jgi:hypothetical protein
MRGLILIDRLTIGEPEQVNAVSFAFHGAGQN